MPQEWFRDFLEGVQYRMGKLDRLPSDLWEPRCEIASNPKNRDVESPCGVCAGCRPPKRVFEK